MNYGQLFNRPPTMPTSTTVLLHPPGTSHLPTILPHKMFDLCHLYSTQSFQSPSCSPEIGQLFFILGVHWKGECPVPVSCSKLKQEADDNDGCCVEFVKWFLEPTFPFSVNRPAYRQGFFIFIQQNSFHFLKQRAIRLINNNDTNS